MLICKQSALFKIKAILLSIVYYFKYSILNIDLICQIDNLIQKRQNKNGLIDIF